MKFPNGRPVDFIGVMLLAGSVFAVCALVWVFAGRYCPADTGCPLYPPCNPGSVQVRAKIGWTQHKDWRGNIYYTEAYQTRCEDGPEMDQE